MDYDDHRDFISTGSSQDSKDWRAAQADLISQRLQQLAIAVRRAPASGALGLRGA